MSNKINVENGIELSERELFVAELLATPEAEEESEVSYSAHIGALLDGELWLSVEKFRRPYGAQAARSCGTEYLATLLTNPNDCEEERAWAVLHH